MPDALLGRNICIRSRGKCKLRPTEFTNHCIDSMRAIPKSIAKYMKSVPMRAIILGAVLVVVLVSVLWRWQRRKPAAVATYVGPQPCAQCHAQQVQAWRSSHHAQAMQAANNSTVLGNFNDVHFAKDGVASSFFKKDSEFYVRTDGSYGKLQDFDFPYTFGVSPLQQYLVLFPDGRLQAYVVAWDSRSREHDGQRWFYLYPDQKIRPSDPLHWTGRNQTWNYMCADCHATNLQKNYDLAKDSYATKWSDIDVSCEACHGPGSNHIVWAQTHKKGSSKESDGPKGLVVDLRPAKGSWSTLNSWESGTRHWQGQTRFHNEINACAPCHSRRHKITSDYQPGQPFLDAYVPSLLEEGIYYADGQVLDQDYEWGSFIQSKMYREGVTCSDCHDPHSGKLPPGSMNSLCGTCHLLGKFGIEDHHHHKTESTGAQCVNCHMAARTDMVVGVEHDHSFRLPRPDFSIAYGTPNACNQCHKDKSNSWAADTIVKWYGSSRRREGHFVEAIDAGRRGLPNAERALTALIVDSAQPGIARATALSLLPQYLTPYSFPVLPASLGDDPLVRREAVRALAPLTPQDRVRLGAPLLTDPVRSVRIEAARVLAGTSPSLLQGAQKTAFDRAISELIASEMASAERPESHMDLALLYARMERPSDTESELKIALHLDPNFVPAMVSLADLYGAQNRDDEAQRWLEKAIAVAPNAAEPIYALALLKIKQKKYGDVINLLAKAATLRPENLAYSYVYAVALNSSGHTDQAIAILQQAHQRRPADRQILIGLIAFERDKANLSSAITYARQLVELAPTEPSAKAMLSELVVANDPNTYQYWLTQGDAEYKQGHLAIARVAFQKGIDLAQAELAGNPRRAYTHAFVAYFAAKLDDKVRAEQEIRQALELSPGDDKIIRRAVLTYEALGERDRAIEVLGRATPQLLYDLNRQPDLPTLRDDLSFQKLLSMTQREGR